MLILSRGDRFWAGDWGGGGGGRAGRGGAGGGGGGGAGNTVDQLRHSGQN